MLVNSSLAPPYPLPMTALYTWSMLAPTVLQASQQCKNQLVRPPADRL